MTTLHSDLGAEVGPDHHFLVVPAIGEYLSLIAKGGLWAHRGPAKCSLLGLVAPATLIIVFSFAQLPGPFLYGIPPPPLAPCVLLTFDAPAAHCRFAPC